MTQRLLSSIDYKTISDKRRHNFNLIHKELGSRNKLNLNISSTEIPMVYPFLVENGKLLKQKLISNKIYVASYWPNVLEWSETTSHEYNIVSNLIALPIDQRYGTSEMSLIISFFNDIIDK
ncbi:MAG TPA: hypothetical protein GX708_08075 [Gallicola sp.]|nr:hypothetical protein [Gallicola sp.]